MRAAWAAKGAGATLRGCVTDPKSAAISTATVCAIPNVESEEEDLTTALCSRVDDDGCYTLSLHSGRYDVVASARDYLPVRYQSPTSEPWVSLADDEARVGVDFVLNSGGILLQGRVRDYLARPVEGASVDTLVDSVPVLVHTDVQGAFTITVKEGDVTLHAGASGYAPSVATGHAPGHYFEVTLDAESVVAGRAIDATSLAAVAGARVCVDLERKHDGTAKSSDPTQRCTLSTADGRFRLDRLSSGRYMPTATAPRRRGAASQSVQVGFGETSQDVTIALREGFDVTGRVVVSETGAPCTEGTVFLEDGLWNGPEASIDRAGIVAFGAILPGAYGVEVHCAGVVESAHAATLLVTSDVAGAVWMIHRGRSLHGLVLDEQGRPVVGATIAAVRSVVRSASDGRFAFEGAGNADNLHITAPGFADTDLAWLAPRSGAVSDLRIVLAPAGSVSGDVVDRHGTAVVGATVQAEVSTPAVNDRSGTSLSTPSAHALTDDRGAFTLRGVSTHAITVRATSRGGATTEVAFDLSSGTARVHLVLDNEDGVIRGRVVDAAGAPVAEAVVRAKAEGPDGTLAALHDLRGGSGKEALSSADGAFAIEHLATGHYSLRASDAGVEAVASGVAVDGPSVILTLLPTRTVAGRVTTRKGLPATDFRIEVHASDGSADRQERFSSPTGVFSIDGLPASAIVIAASTGDARVSQPASLVEADVQDLELVLVPQAHLRGHVVWMDSGAPIPALDINVSGMQRSTDEAGTFDVVGLSPGVTTVLFSGLLPELYPGTDRQDYAERTIRMPEEGDLDLGALTLPRARLSPGERAGMFGFRVQRGPVAETGGVVVQSVIAGTAAEEAGLVTGDVITAVDSFDLSHGDEAYWPLLTAAPGTTATFTLARGASFGVVSRARQ